MFKIPPPPPCRHNSRAECGPHQVSPEPGKFVAVTKISKKNQKKSKNYQSESDMMGSNNLPGRLRTRCYSPTCRASDVARAQRAGARTGVRSAHAREGARSARRRSPRAKRAPCFAALCRDTAGPTSNRTARPRRSSVSPSSRPAQPCVVRAYDTSSHPRSAGTQRVRAQRHTRQPNIQDHQVRSRSLGFFWVVGVIAKTPVVIFYGGIDKNSCHWHDSAAAVPAPIGRCMRSF